MAIYTPAVFKVKRLFPRLPGLHIKRLYTRQPFLMRKCYIHGCWAYIWKWLYIRQPFSRKKGVYTAAGPKYENGFIHGSCFQCKLKWLYTRQPGSKYKNGYIHWKTTVSELSLSWKILPFLEWQTVKNTPPPPPTKFVSVGSAAVYIAIFHCNQLACKYPFFSSSRPSTSLNCISSEAMKPILTKFHI